MAGKFNFFTGEWEDDTNLNYSPVERQSDQSFAQFANPESYAFFNNANNQTPHTNPWIPEITKPKGPFDDMTTGDWFTAAQQGANAIGSLYNIYQGNKMLGLYQDQFDFNKKLSKTNLFNQAQTVNAEMSDRQRMRNSMGAGLSTEDYMKKYGVRGKM